MLLQRLREYSERLDLPPSLYAETPVRYLIDLHPDGTFENITDTADSSSPKTRRGTPRLVPQVKRSVGIKPLLLADNAEYTFGLAREGSRPERVESTHEAYLELLDECLAATNAPEVAAVRTFLTTPGWNEGTFPEDFDRAATSTFRVGEQFVTDLPAVQAFWATTNAPDEGAIRMQCLTCGQERPVLERLQTVIKGIPGGQTSGTSIISANASAFESYGLTASLTAPTCSDCAERFTRSLNELLANERSRIRFGDSVYVFWTRDDQAQGLVPLLEEASPAEVKLLLESVKTGKRAVGPNPERFFALALSAAGGRAVVREWIDTTLPEAEEALARWFRRQGIVDGFSEETRYFGIRSLAGATVRDWRDISPPTTRTLLRAALTGSPLPMDMLAAAVRRTQADQGVNAPQAALIKLVLMSRDGDEEEDHMTELQADHPSAGYQCGRLMAVLESIQRTALPGVKAGVVDRYFGSASSSPAGVFPRLVRGAQPHLGRLERDRPGAYVALQRRLEEVLSQVDEFPAILRLEEQGRFALGYYHQRAHDRARAVAAKARVAAGQATDQDRRDADLDEEDSND